MKKKISAFLLAFIMCISFSTVAFAAGEETSYIIDEVGYLKLVGGTGVVESFSEHSTIILNELTRVVDMADLLDNSEEAALLSMLDEISIRQ